MLIVWCNSVFCGRTSAYLTVQIFVLFLRGLRRVESLWMAGYCPFPACLPSRGTVTSTLMSISVTFHKGEDVSEVLELKQACVREESLEETDPGSSQLREGWGSPTLSVIAERLYKNSEMQEHFLANCERGVHLWAFLLLQELFVYSRVSNLIVKSALTVNWCLPESAASQQWLWCTQSCPSNCTVSSEAQIIRLKH